MSSKQHPRKLSIYGSNGIEYNFLLKGIYLFIVLLEQQTILILIITCSLYSTGHEDLRQDERVMQLFGLVNTLLASEFETSRNHLSIERYSAVPLAPNSGLIGWVPHCDTMHALIRSYRSVGPNF